MNKIEFPRYDVDGNRWEEETLQTWYWEKSGIMPEITKQIDSTILSLSADQKKELIFLKIIRNHIKEILIAKPEQLEAWALIVDTKCKDISCGADGKKTDFWKYLYVNVFAYDVHRKKELISLAKYLNVKTCPYCNMHYTLYAEEGPYKKDRLTKLQFDHFLDKSDYPMFSMSLYNLVPSCAVCNQGKSTGRLSLDFHPYVSNISDKFHFSINQHRLDAVQGAILPDKVRVSVIGNKGVNPQELELFKNMFHLEALYGRHGDIVQEVYDKAYLRPFYSELDNFPFLVDKVHDSKEKQAYLKRLLLGVYVEKEYIEKRPMSKFIIDLWDDVVKILPDEP